MKATDPVTTPPAAPAPPTLAYGRSRRSYRREVKIALFVLPTLALAWWALPRVPSRLKFLSQQSALMRLTRTAGTAVWDRPAQDAAGADEALAPA